MGGLVELFQEIESPEQNLNVHQNVPIFQNNENILEIPVEPFINNPQCDISAESGIFDN